MNKSAVQVKFCDEHPGVANLRDEVLAGLGRTPKRIAPKFFYDQKGSELFDAICEQPEYYLTRTEIAILRRYAKDIASLAGDKCWLLELGSGASKKVRLLLEALRPAAYWGVDISREFLLRSTRRLAADYPWLEVHAICADFSRGLSLFNHHPAGKTLAFFPGSSIGNFTPIEAVDFLSSLRAALQPGDAVLVGVDLKKDQAILNAAYNDVRGVTAEFNLNLLARIKSELGVRIDETAFMHRAFYNEREGRIEMYLVSRRKQQVDVGGRRFHVEQGESIHTENSYKYTVEEFQVLARRAGYRPIDTWVDEKAYFSVHFLEIGGA
jgi:dimethylhistidine N-methyltransferase